MAQGIELLPEIAVGETEKGVYKRSVNIVAIVALLIAAAILFGLFGYQFFLTSTVKRIETQTRAAEKKILSASRKEITHRLLVDKLDKAEEFLSSQLPHSEGFKELINVLKSSGAILTESKFENNGTLTITGEAVNSKILSKLVAGLTNEDVADTFGDVKLVSLTKEKVSKGCKEKPKEALPYIFTIDVKFLKKGIQEATSSAQSRKL
ncbi:MAG TPA: hypothetical protein VF303_03625 [Candidatus Nanoarchaeia archaeon]